MKKYIWTLLVAVVAFACADEDYESATREYVGINNAGLVTSVAENSAGISIPLYYGGDFVNSRPVTVTYEITGGTYGTDYTVVDGTGATGTIVIPTGTPFKDALKKLVVKGVPDFDNEPDVHLVLTLKSADNDVKVGYPMLGSYAFTIADDDCLYDFEGDLFDGYDTNFDGLNHKGPSHISITQTSPTELEVTGIGVDMIQDYFWGETITDAAPTVVKLAPGGALTIDEQYIYTTDYNGDPYVYNIKGTGQINYCEGTVSLSYDIYYADGSGSIAEYAHTHPSTPPVYMSTALFQAVVFAKED